jgi:hypothetical protein
MMIEPQRIPERRVCTLCDEVVTDPHEHGIGLRFCERDVYAPCARCTEYVEASSLALEFYNTATERLLCERCAVRNGVSFALWAAFRYGLVWDWGWW